MKYKMIDMYVDIVLVVVEKYFPQCHIVNANQLID